MRKGFCDFALSAILVIQSFPAVNFTVEGSGPECRKEKTQIVVKEKKGSEKSGRKPGQQTKQQQDRN